MNPFARSKDYEDSRRIVDYSSTFNTDTKLEFNILPDKRYLSLRDTLLTFSIELPQEVIPDNFFGSTIFENLGESYRPDDIILIIFFQKSTLIMN